MYLVVLVSSFALHSQQNPLFPNSNGLMSTTYQPMAFTNPPCNCNCFPHLYQHYPPDIQAYVLLPHGFTPSNRQDPSPSSTEVELAYHTEQDGLQRETMGKPPRHKKQSCGKIGEEKKEDDIDAQPMEEDVITTPLVSEHTISITTNSLKQLPPPSSEERSQPHRILRSHQRIPPKSTGGRDGGRYIAEVDEFHGVS